jgi:hypothetical protein
MRALPIILFLLFSVLPLSAQDPLIYKRAEVIIALRDDGSATMSLSYEIENRAWVPVVPGYGYLEFNSGRILKASASINGKKTEVIVNGSNLRYSIWEIIEPGKAINVRVNVTVSDFLSKGIIFDEFQARIGPLSYEVEEVDLRVIPPNGMNIVYLKGEGRPLKPGEAIDIEGEVSALPLPNIGVRWYPLVWLIIIAASIAAVVLVRRR